MQGLSLSLSLSIRSLPRASGLALGRSLLLSLSLGLSRSLCEALLISHHLGAPCVPRLRSQMYALKLERRRSASERRGPRSGLPRPGLPTPSLMLGRIESGCG